MDHAHRGVVLSSVKSALLKVLALTFSSVVLPSLLMAFCIHVELYVEPVNFYLFLYYI